jgi:hypothetical protein
MQQAWALLLKAHFSGRMSRIGSVSLVVLLTILQLLLWQTVVYVSGSHMVVFEIHAKVEHNFCFLCRMRWLKLVFGMTR